MTTLTKVKPDAFDSNVAGAFTGRNDGLVFRPPIVLSIQ